MTYCEALNYILYTPRFAKTNTLERISFILSALGNPERDLKFVHVAGTNGKGSTVTMISHILKAAGYRVGTFVSPFVYDFRERIQFNCELIDKDTFASLTAQVKSIVDQMTDRPNAFEILTAIAIAYFQRTACDIAVIEVGLGGRWDATNVIPAPQLAVITSIALDHTELLGDTLEKIAGEKCGIIKSGSPVVTSAYHPPEVLDVIKHTAESLDVPLSIPDTHVLSVLSETIDGTEFCYKDLTVTIALSGKHQIENAMTVLESIFVLQTAGFQITEAAIKEGLRKSSFPARMEIVRQKPLIVIDGAHNEAGMRALTSAITRLLPNRRIVTVFGCLSDKGYTEMTRLIAKVSDNLIITRPNSPRACEPETIARIATKYCPHVSVIPEVSDAVKKAKLLSDDVLFICGSLYLAGDARAFL